MASGDTPLPDVASGVGVGVGATGAGAGVGVTAGVVETVVVC